MRRLPHSELVVSELALGTMTFGDQVSQDSAMSLLDVATGELGINFIVSGCDPYHMTLTSVGHRGELPGSLGSEHFR